MGLKILNQTIIDDSKNFNLSECIFSDGTKLSTVNKPLTLLNFYSLQVLNTLNNPNDYSNSAVNYFGYSVNISGDKCIVGAYQAGKAYIFDVTTGALLQTLDNPNAYSTSQNDRFGFSVGISGDKCIVGARQEDDLGGIDSGKAYIFDVTTGALLFTLNNPNAYSISAYDYFGSSVAISGDKCIVGAHQEGDSGGVQSGKAYIFDVTTGALLHTLDNPNAYMTSATDNFGNSVAIDGDKCIVGAYYERDSGGGQSGKAYIFDVTTGALLFTLNNPNAYSTSAIDYFGSSVAISGDKCIVGVYGEDDSGGGQSGKAYIFDVTTGALLQTLNNPNAYSTSADDNFGSSVGISGTKCIVGAYPEDDSGGSSSGKAYIFDVTTGALLFTLNNPNTFGNSAYDNFGNSVGISGDKCIVGAYQEDEQDGNAAGKAYIFDVNQSYIYKRRITNVDMISFANINVDDKLMSMYKSSTYFDKLIQLGVNKYGV